MVLVATVFLLTARGSADTIMDKYIGASPTDISYVGRDVIGSQDLFDISKMEVNFTPGVMTVDIYSAYFDNVGELGTTLGDLFVSTDGYHPKVPTSLDDRRNGEKWEYAAVLNDSGSVSVYAVDENNINPSSAPAGYIYREHQEVGYDPSAGENSLGTGEWVNHDTYLRISLDMTNIGWDWTGQSDLGLHWTMSCGNDVIEGKVPAPVPEPATMLLFGTGLIGMAVVGRKKIHKQS